MNILKQMNRAILLITVICMSACVVVIGDDEDVNYNASTYSTDNELSENIENKLNQATNLVIYDLDVEADGDTVFLFGEAKTVTDLQRAIDLAMQQPEVSNVTSELTIRAYK